MNTHKPFLAKACLNLDEFDIWRTHLDTFLKTELGTELNPQRLNQKTAKLLGYKNHNQAHAILKTKAEPNLTKDRRELSSFVEYIDEPERYHAKIMAWLANQATSTTGAELTFYTVYTAVRALFPVHCDGILELVHEHNATTDTLFWPQLIDAIDRVGLRTHHPQHQTFITSTALYTHQPHSSFAWLVTIEAREGNLLTIPMIQTAINQMNHLFEDGDERGKYDESETLSDLQPSDKLRLTHGHLQETQCKSVVLIYSPRFRERISVRF